MMKTRPKIIASRELVPIKFPCFIELSKSGTKLHVSFDGDDLPGAIDRIDEALGIRAYAVNAFINHIEKMEKGLK